MKIELINISALGLEEMFSIWEMDMLLRWLEIKRGKLKNQVEHQIALDDRSNIFAKIIQISEDHKWLIMERADKIKSMSQVWEYFNVKNNRELFKIAELKDITFKYDLLVADLYRPTNWGKVDDRFVIIDYGFNRKVKKKFYFPF